MNTFGALIVTAAMGASAAAVAALSPPAQPGISISEVAPDRFELVYSGTTFTSRDAPERALLLSSARLAIAHGQNSFTLLALEGERQDDHPIRPKVAFGGNYGHWQPHWTYYTAQYGWQWWHPEWGTGFWTKDVDPKTVTRFEVHAMIELGESGNLVDSLGFDAKEVVRDLNGPLPAAH